ncbi:MAG: PhoH family protein [Pseudomonadota bacterium]
MKRDFVFRLKGIFHPVRPLSLAQVAYMDDLLDKRAPLVFGVGPTGTGKTHLAIAAALSQLASEEIKRIVVTRPHILQEGEVMTAEMRAETRRDDQFAPIFDVLHDLLRHDDIAQLIDQRRLEILPLGLIRGRTFNDSSIIVDEAQDMTVQRMRMAVTRLGRRSRMVVTGDPSQVTLRTDEPSGLAHLLNLLRETDVARIHEFKRGEIIRNETVAKLEALYAAA